MMKSTILKLLPYAAILVLASMLISKCKNESILEDSLVAANSETRHFKNQLGTITSEREVLKLDKRMLQDQIDKDEILKKLASEFSEIKVIVKTQAKVKFDTIRIPFEIKAPCDFERLGVVETDWYNLGYKVNQNGLQIEPFQTWTDVTSITGFKQNWFWGKKTYVTDVTASNPFISIPEVQVYEKAVPVKWYESTLFKVGVGFLGGALLIK